MQQILGLVRRCVEDYHMISPGETVAVGVSGGKDSLLTLVALSRLRQFFPVPFAVHAITLETGTPGMSFDAVAELCRERHLPVNVVDDRELCSFLFPALVKRGSLSVGISTGGARPTAAIYLKEQIAALLPENFEELLAFLDSLRPMLKAEIPEEARRSKAFSRLFRSCMAAERPLTSQEVRAILDHQH